MAQPGPAYLANGRTDGYRRGRIDAPELEGDEKQQYRENVEQELHDRQGKMIGGIMDSSAGRCPTAIG